MDQFAVVTWPTTAEGNYAPGFKLSEMKKILIPATGLMLVFVAFLIMRSGTSDPAVRSIQDYDKTLHVTARDWAQFMRNPEPHRMGSPAHPA